MTLKITKDEYVVCAYPKMAAGPGWANTPIVVVIKNRLNNTYREEYIQPKEQTDTMRIMFPVLNAAHFAVMNDIDANTKVTRAKMPKE